MGLRDDFTTAMKEAMKSGAKERLGTIRLINSALKDRDIEARGNGKEPLSDEDIVAMLQKLIKQRQDSVTLYRQGNREDLAANEEAEIAIIRTFMPQQMSADETRAAVAAAIAETGAASIKDMGKVMGVLKGKYTGKMDFGAVAPIIKDLLG